jgi:flagellar biosynthesis/type III secretory pathway protein FliH
MNSSDTLRGWDPPAVALDRRSRGPRFGSGRTPDGMDPETAAAHAALQRRAFDEGYRAGRDDASEALRETTAALARLVTELAESKAALLKDVEANLTAVALSAARHLVGRDVAADPTIVAELVSRGIDLVKPDSPLTIRMNAADIDAVRDRLTPALEHESMTVRWVSDDTMARGGYLLESPGRLVDGRLEESLRALYERIVYE